MNEIKSTSGPGIRAGMAGLRRFMLPHGVALLCALPLVGCLAQDGDAADEDVGVEQQAAFTNNALTNNALSDSNARAVLKYIVSCALPAGRQVSFVADGVSYSYPGELGLAPEWELTNGTCNKSCQQWVSACVMARVDYLGEKVLISARGDTSVLRASLTERYSYSVREGTYFGNIFAATTERYACIAPGRTGLPRVCGPTTVGCVVEALGSCSQVCDKIGSDGSFRQCSNEDSNAAQDQPKFKDTTYDGTVTVFLAP